MIVAVIPFKGGESVKSRLSPAISSEDRALLAHRLLQHVLQTARGTPSIDLVGVVSEEPRYDAAWIPDPGRGLNEALIAGREWAITQGAHCMLILPADLPFLTSGDIVALTSAVDHGNAHGVLAPSKDGGTGALLLAPPRLIEPSFGQASAYKHAEALRSRGVEPVLLHRSGLALDIDLPEDLDLLGDELLDIIWTGKGIYGRGAIDRANQTREYLAGANLQE